MFNVIGEQRFDVPQGSVFSGLLFLIYINSLRNGLVEGNLVAFADDTALFYKADFSDKLQENMQHDINTLRWCLTNSLMVMSPKPYTLFSIKGKILFCIASEISCN